MDRENVRNKGANGDDGQTPDWLAVYLRENFEITHDPCPVNPVVDGLTTDWPGFSYVNPPSSDCQNWVMKAIEQQAKGNYSVVLSPFVPNTCYW